VRHLCGRVRSTLGRRSFLFFAWNRNTKDSVPTVIEIGVNRGLYPASIAQICVFACLAQLIVMGLESFDARGGLVDSDQFSCRRFEHASLRTKGGASFFRMKVFMIQFLFLPQVHHFPMTLRQA